MDRPRALLQDLRNKLSRQHLVRIQRALGGGEARIVLGNEGEFVIEFHPLKGAEVYRKEFTRALVFASTMHLSPHAWAIEKRACDYAQDFVREVLQKRGIL